MIFVILGTQDKPFTRLLEAIDRCDINERIVVQAGYTQYSSSKMEVFDYVGNQDFENYLKEADLIICHGGIGTIMQAVNFDKKIIAIPRLKEFHEHHNNHQKEVLDNFATEGYVLTTDNLANLNQLIVASKTFKPRQYRSNNSNFINLINNFIEGK